MWSLTVTLTNPSIPIKRVKSQNKKRLTKTKIRINGEAHEIKIKRGLRGTSSTKSKVSNSDHIGI